MRTYRHKNFFGFLILNLLLQHFLVVPPTYACTCGGKRNLSAQPFEHRFSRSEAVFQGRVTKVYSYFIPHKFIHDYTPNWSHKFVSDKIWVRSYLVNIDVDVSSSWKGVDQKSITIYQEFNGCEGATPFVVGKEYLFFGQKYNKYYPDSFVLTVWNCGHGTHEISYDNAKLDLENLKDFETIPLSLNNAYGFLAFAALTFLIASYLIKAWFRFGRR